MGDSQKPIYLYDVCPFQNHTVLGIYKMLSDLSKKETCVVTPVF